jgi:phi13 family phage major tail protein
MPATKIGCDNLVAAQVYEAIDGTPTFGIIKSLPGVMNLTVNPNASAETLFCDDGPGDTASTIGKVEVEIEKNVLTVAEKAFLLGHGLDTNGGLVSGSSDVPPWVALGFRSLKTNGTYRYVWLYKGKFSDPEDKNETKGDSVKFNTDTIKGNFVTLNKNYSINGRTVKPYKYEMDEDGTGINLSVIRQWFTQVILPNAAIAAPTTAPALTVATAAGTVLTATKATITGTATSKFAIGIGAVSQGTLYVGQVPTGIIISNYTSAADIVGVVAGQYLYVYDLDANGLIAKYYEKALVAGDIKSS